MALEHATRSVRVWQLTMFPSFSRAFQIGVVASRRAGQAACCVGWDPTTHCEFMQGLPLLNRLIAGTQGSPLRSKLAQQRRWSRIVSHCVGAPFEPVAITRVRDVSRRRSIDESTGRRVVCMRAPTAQGGTSAIPHWLVLDALWLHSSPSQ